MVSGPGNGFGNLPGVFLGTCHVKFARGFIPVSKSLAKGNVSCSEQLPYKPSSSITFDDSQGSYCEVERQLINILIYG